ncbi:hypothetical protein GK047_18940 [Paenibacillus sp. SYP-B3998]|uniref:Uncharacterized protein n=1 Tax=Paenibacillus sp. SYP-B3998 TaxID=2678564 RepID=A0A6G4A2N3_9BACL|nr:hypothetical protein [Paenibacillus sp. SYP-B3998]NEW08081.1 hypothetical protein [Paenibacillus sp. SYP-B3998]
MYQAGINQRKLTAYWLFNIGLGLPSPSIFIFIIINYYGLMSTPKQLEQYLALGLLIIYLLIWLGGNYLCLRAENWSTRMGMLALSPLLITTSAFIAYKIIALFTI